ncbi:hypothetical protein [Streptomyces sp. HUAS ZL42]|uniref:hypothetical protein n=1 Tax=Streptomyces sp. HUAS ZL42 TaxID=3231715 RepID=UPI00345EA611
MNICRHCDALIIDEEDGVLLWHEPGNSGPGWDVWAHREHAHLVLPDPTPLRLLARVLAARRKGEGA